ncbi:MAG: hypothetical protein NVS4B12_28030 [Ktedonobacteraceae bacterium]
MEQTRTIPVRLADGTIIKVQATAMGGDQPAGFKVPQFEDVTKSIQGIAQSMLGTLQKLPVKPKKASVEFGLEIAAESGTLTTVLVKGSGTANLKITLEWGE